jgi:hypothetical protein
VEYGTINALSTVLLVNQALVSVADFNKLLGLVSIISKADRAATFLLALNAVNVNTSVLINNVFNESFIPSIGYNLVLQFLWCVVSTPETVRRTLRVSNIGREEEVPIGCECLDIGCIDLTAYNRQFSNSSLAEFLECFLRTFLE